MLIAQQELPQKIKELRGEQSQADFGARFGVSRQAVDRWEKGTAIPAIKVLRELQIEKVFLITDSSNIGLKPAELAIMDSIERKPDHDSANCRLYGCLMCKMLKSANG